MLVAAAVAVGAKLARYEDAARAWNGERWERTTTFCCLWRRSDWRVVEIGFFRIDLVRGAFGGGGLRASTKVVGKTSDAECDA